MKIELESPYREIFRRGNVRIGNEKRRIVDLIRLDGTQTSTSYARYLVTVKLGKFLPDGYEVDHIDEDPLNDSLDNLQVLSKDEHIAKTIANKDPAPIVVLKCPVCLIDFEFLLRNLETRPNPCCSRICGGIKSHITSAEMGNKRPKSPLVNCICHICGKTFQIQERLLKVRPNPSCSRSCRSIISNRARWGTNQSL